MKRILTVAILCIFFASCREDNQNNNSEFSTTGVLGNSMLEGSADDAQAISDQAFTGALTTFREADNFGFACATITHDTVSSPREIIIDFGTTNCLGADGRNRRGKIICAYQGAYRDSGYTHVISFDNFYLNDNQILGSRTILNEGHNLVGNAVYSINDDHSVVFTDGSTMTRTAVRSREWILGAATSAWNDDVYLITGTASGTNAEGDSYTSSTTTALRKEIGCRWIVSGVLEITPAGKLPRILNFGSGDCDDIATVSVGSYTKTITLR